MSTNLCVCFDHKSFCFGQYALLERIPLLTVASSKLGAVIVITAVLYFYGNWQLCLSHLSIMSTRLNLSRFFSLFDIFLAEITD